MVADTAYRIYVAVAVFSSVLSFENFVKKEINGVGFDTQCTNNRNVKAVTVGRRYRRRYSGNC